ncbi:MAG: CheR family methyltransferase [Spirochaetia bacterium]
MATTLHDDDFNKFRTLIYDESGIHFTETNRSILESRLRERLRSTGDTTATAYYTRVRNDKEELRALLDSVTTNLTRFFRNTAHFETFERVVLPELIARKKREGKRHLKVWSAGCSTGEEPYSLAMVMKEVLPRDFTFSVLASDISLKSLMSARSGYYADSKVKGVPERYLERYFDRKEKGCQVKKEIMDTVTFDYHNLKHPSGLMDVDIVFCRNVIIYFDEAAQKATVRRFWDVMTPYSYLFIGHSESLFGMKTEFEFVRTDWACVYRKNTTG